MQALVATAADKKGDSIVPISSHPTPVHLRSITHTHPRWTSASPLPSHLSPCFYQHLYAWRYRGDPEKASSSWYAVTCGECCRIQNTTEHQAGRDVPDHHNYRRNGHTFAVDIQCVTNTGLAMLPEGRGVVLHRNSPQSG